MSPGMSLEIDVTEGSQGEGARRSGAPSPLERRRKRSADPITALHYQLALTRASAGLDAVVLVDDAGCLIAGAGAWPACEELAAYAPLLARPAEIVSGPLSSRVHSLSEEAVVRPVGKAPSAGALLCGRGGGEGRAELIERAAEGCRRILGLD